MLVKTGWSLTLPCTEINLSRLVLHYLTVMSNWTPTESTLSVDVRYPFEIRKQTDADTSKLWESDEATSFCFTDVGRLLL